MNPIANDPFDDLFSETLENVDEHLTRAGQSADNDIKAYWLDRAREGMKEARKIAEMQGAAPNKRPSSGPLAPGPAFGQPLASTHTGPNLPGSITQKHTNIANPYFSQKSSPFPKTAPASDGREVAPNDKVIDLTVKCDICGKQRNHVDISVYSYEVSAKSADKYNFSRNIKYCNDNLQCFKAAKERELEDPSSLPSSGGGGGAEKAFNQTTGTYLVESKLPSDRNWNFLPIDPGPTWGA